MARVGQVTTGIGQSGCCRGDIAAGACGAEIWSSHEIVKFTSLIVAALHTNSKCKGMQEVMKHASWNRATRTTPPRLPAPG